MVQSRLPDSLIMGNGRMKRCSLRCSLHTIDNDVIDKYLNVEKSYSCQSQLHPSGPGIIRRPHDFPINISAEEVWSPG